VAILDSGVNEPDIKLSSPISAPFLLGVINLNTGTVSFVKPFSFKYLSVLAFTSGSFSIFAIN